MDPETEDAAKLRQVAREFSEAWWRCWPPHRRWDFASLQAYLACRNDWIAGGGPAPLEEWIARWMRERG